MQFSIREGDIPGVQLRQMRRLDTPRRDVWLWLTEADRLGRWLAEEVAPLDEAVGWRLRSIDESGEALVETGRQESVDPGRRWVLVFGRHCAGWESATRLTIELSGEDRCSLSVLQSGFERLSLSRCLPAWEFYRRRWRRALDRLEEELRRSGDGG